MNFSKTEIIHLLLSIIALGIAFAIAYETEFFLAVLTLGLAFILHELAHKLAAQHYGCMAEFRADFRMLILAVLLSFLGVVFAAPGAVLIASRRPMKKKEFGLIAAAGPTANIILSAIFLTLFVIGSAPLKTVSAVGFMVNSWVSLFNIIPFMDFDGRKVLYWSRAVFWTMTIISALLVIISEFFVNVPPVQ